MEAIAVIDFGSQYTHLIVSRLRRMGVYAEILLPESPLATLRTYKGIILSGGPQSVYEYGSPTVDRRIFSLGIPVLGLCYGHQLMAHLLGGRVEPGTTKEYGYAELHVVKKNGVFLGVRPVSQVWMSHGDSVTTAAPGFEVTGKTEDCPIAAAENPRKKLFSVQFHIEVAHTPEGGKIMKNFVRICGVKRTWSTDLFFREKVHELREKLEGKNVFLLVSGGVDSTVAYAFLSRVIGSERVHGLFVDTGFLRKREGAIIAAALKKIGVTNLHRVNAGARFRASLKGVCDPEEKRRIIGDLFLKIQAEESKRLRLDVRHWVLGQGTIYPDTIESAGTKHADRIKTHHNRVPEILRMIQEGKVVEPLAQLYKDEVRDLGRKLGLPDEIVWRHPFPGPGLAIRILCAEREKMPEESERATEEISSFLMPHGLIGNILPIRSVGVQGDSRTYRNPLAIFGKRHELPDLESISTSLTNNFSQINRVCLLLSPEKIHRVRLIPGDLSDKRVRHLQLLDDIVMRFVASHGLMKEMWQFPTVLLPIAVNGSAKESIVLRPICSNEAMTAHFYKMPHALLRTLVKKLSPYVSAVFYDITNKPPGTIEWE